MAPSELLIFPTPILAVKGVVCHTCFSAVPNLNKCGKCRRVFYCSQDCQKKDWKKGHKALCPVLVKFNNLDTATAHRTWDEYRSEMWIRVDVFRSQKPRPPLNDERILTYEPHCTKCHRNPFQLLPNESLHLCKLCSLVHTCTACPSATHPCTQYTSVSIAESFSISHYLTSSEVNLQMPTTNPRKTYLPLSTIKNWYEYYTILSDKQMVLNLLSADLKPLAGNQEMASALTSATDRMTMMLTILAGLEAVFPDLGSKKEIKLHLIGATAKECDALMLFEELFHLLPSLKKLHCTFIGPQLPTPVDGNKTIPVNCCPTCTSSHRTRSMNMFQLPYHTYVKSSHFEKPDLGVAFHTGHSQEAVEGWKPSIEALVKAGYPTVFTCFNEKEMKEETEGLRTLGAQFLVEGERNRWRGMRPMLEVMEEVEHSVYFNNQFWYVIKGE